MSRRLSTLAGVPQFSFLTNHALALLCIAEDPRVRMRDIAATVDITERAAQRIVADLIVAGYIERARDGRRNVYTIRTDVPVKLASKRDIGLESLLEVLVPARSRDEGAPIADVV
jgi:DNA-binding MarR family transcriptional regulator